jgi:hypothetical protein
MSDFFERKKGIGFALLAAVFGLSTPLAKSVSPQVHGPGDPPGEPHTHRHRHEPLTHSHPHYPDIHHRHGHGADRKIA